jgi:hypothetical protein|tara:strand:- start:15 stop:428 length:414 start_codon:yes stop_codon:yes gene_type:complete
MTRAAEMAKIVGKGSVDIHGEAGTTSSGSTGKTTNLQQGLCKAWFKFNQDTPAISDSFNTSSIADDGTGSHRGLFTNNMSNANFANTAMKQAESTNADCTEYTTGSNSTSQVERKDVENNAVRDAANTNTLTFGDLA